MNMEEKKYCYKYPHPAVTADCVVFCVDRGETSVLLVERGGEPFKGYWALPGGFLNPDESAEQAGRRELEEETGLKVPRLEQLGAYSEPGRDPREWVITIAHIAIVEKQDVKGSDDAADARWFPVDSVPPLAFDHARILADALRHCNFNG